MTHKYIGTKEIVAWPERRETDRAGETRMFTDGYAVKYPDGYTSWSPAAAFEQAYRIAEGPAQALTFGDAIHFLKQGKRVARAGWNGKGMFVWLERGNRAWDEHTPEPTFIGGVNQQLFGRGDHGTSVRMPHLCMRAADGATVTGWLASQTDMLAEDWMVLEPVAAELPFDPTVVHEGEERESLFSTRESDAMEKIMARIKAKIPVEWRRCVTIEHRVDPNYDAMVVHWKFAPPVVQPMVQGGEYEGS